MSAITKHYVFHGRVQGVGFRYTAANIARNYSVSGYVKNLDNGTVEIAVCGDEAIVNSFIEQLRRAMADNIRQVVVSQLNTREDFNSFQIR